MRIITRTVLILSVVSLLADVASEMLYPVMPIYLKEIGFTVFWIGVLEGVVNFSASISKGYFGKLSDEKGVRLPFVKLGYLLSAVSKPLIAVFTYPLWIFFVRTVDRLGKGVRTAARDALLSQEATKETKARVFGFHRGMDTVGAAIGPILALLFLLFNPGEYKTLFYLAFIPGIISIFFIFLLKEKKLPVSTLGKGNFFSFFNYWKVATPEFKSYIQQVKKNAKKMSECMMNKGYSLISNGTDNHLMLWDVKPQGLTGSKIEKVFDLLHITTNKNTIIGDKS